MPANRPDSKFYKKDFISMYDILKESPKESPQVLYSGYKPPKYPADIAAPQIRGFLAGRGYLISTKVRTPPVEVFSSLVPHNLERYRSEVPPRQVSYTPSGGLIHWRALSNSWSRSVGVGLSAAMLLADASDAIHFGTRIVYCIRQADGSDLGMVAGPEELRKVRRLLIGVRSVAVDSGRRLRRETESAFFRLVGKTPNVFVEDFADTYAGQLVATVSTKGKSDWREVFDRVIE